MGFRSARDVFLFFVVVGSFQIANSLKATESVFSQTTLNQMVETDGRIAAIRFAQQISRDPKRPARMRIAAFQWRAAQSDITVTEDLYYTIVAEPRLRHMNSLIDLLMKIEPGAADYLIEIVQDPEHRGNRAAAKLLGILKPAGWSQALSLVLQTQPASPAAPVAMCSLAEHCKPETWLPDAFRVLTSARTHRASKVADFRVNQLCARMIANMIELRRE